MFSRGVLSLTGLVLILLLVGSSDSQRRNSENCTPAGYSKTNLNCTLYFKQSACEKAKRIANTTQFLDPVTAMSADRFMNRMDEQNGGKTGVIISWKSASPNTLLLTKGYLFKLYYKKSNGSKSIEVLTDCRFMRIKASRPDIDRGGKFRITTPSLDLANTEYRAEVTTLPLSNHSQTSSISFTTYGDPSDKFDWNTSYTDEEPYNVTLKFRLSSYREDVNILYNHTYYEIHLYDSGRNWRAGHIGGGKVLSRVVYPSYTKEYGEVLYTNLPPGNYSYDIWPYQVGYHGNCLPNCHNRSDEDQDLTHRYLRVHGYEYDPKALPKLEMHMNGRATVTIQVAPRAYYIASYNISIFSKANRTKALGPKTIISNRASKVWYTEKVEFTPNETYSMFRNGEQVYSEVVPTVVEVLCFKAGECNINGKCKPCRPSTSNISTVRRTPSDLNQTTPGNATAITIATSVVTTVVVILIVIAGSVCYIVKIRRSQTIHSDTKPLQGSVTSSPSTSTQSEENLDVGTIGHWSAEDTHYIASAPPIQVCIAYTTTAQDTVYYNNLFDVLSKILTRFFNCEVVNYEDIRTRHAGLNSFHFVLTLCSPQLHRAYTLAYMRTGDRKERALPPDVIRSCTVLRQLLVPAPNDTFTRAMVTFSHLPSQYSEYLQTAPGTRRVKIYSLPSQLQQLVEMLCSRGACSTEISPIGLSTLPDYIKEQTMHAKLLESIGELERAYWEDLATDCRTVDSEESLVNDQTPLTYNRREDIESMFSSTVTKDTGSGKRIKKDFKSVESEVHAMNALKSSSYFAKNKGTPLTYKVKECESIVTKDTETSERVKQDYKSVASEEYAMSVLKSQRSWEEDTEPRFTTIITNDTGYKSEFADDHSGQQHLFPIKHAKHTMIGGVVNRSVGGAINRSVGGAIDRSVGDRSRGQHRLGGAVTKVNDKTNNSQPTGGISDYGAMGKTSRGNIVHLRQEEEDDVGEIDERGNGKVMCRAVGRTHSDKHISNPGNLSVISEKSDEEDETCCRNKLSSVYAGDVGGAYGENVSSNTFRGGAYGEGVREEEEVRGGDVAGGFYDRHGHIGNLGARGGPYGEERRGGTYGESTSSGASSGDEIGRTYRGGTYHEGAYGEGARGGAYDERARGGAYGEGSRSGAYGESASGSSITYEGGARGGAYGSGASSGAYNDGARGGAYGESLNRSSITYGGGVRGGAYGEDAVSDDYNRAARGGAYVGGSQTRGIEGMTLSGANGGRLRRPADRSINGTAGDDSARAEDSVADEYTVSYRDGRDTRQELTLNERNSLQEPTLTDEESDDYSTSTVNDSYFSK